MLNIKSTINKIVVVMVSMLIVVFSFVVDIDSKGEEIVVHSLEDAVKVFAVAKGLNAAISLAQGTEIGPPGLTITIGEVLDPINDLVEQFSWIMLASITSLGIQKILLNFVTGDIFTFVVIGSIVILNIWMFTRFQQDTKVRSIFFKTTIILVFLRFSIPIMSILNTHAYDAYVKQDYNIQQSQLFIEESTKVINDITTSTIENENTQTAPTKENSIVGTLIEKGKQLANSTANFVSKSFSIDYYKDKIEKYKVATEKTSNDIINLIIAFTFKTMFFPLVFLFLLYQLLKSVFRIGK